MPNVPTKIVAEYYVPAQGVKGGTKKQLLYRYTIEGHRTVDDALRRARERASVDGKRVLSANFGVNEAGDVDRIVVLVARGTEG